MIRWAVTMLLFFLSACATPQPVLHTQAQLNDVGARCGLAMGELFQDDIEQRLLFVMREQPTAREQACVTDFADDNHLNVVLLDGITFEE